MDEDDQWDLFPELPRGKRHKLTYRDQLNSDLKTIRDTFGVPTATIADKIKVPSRTVEGWIYGRNLPPDWACRLLGFELKKLFPR
jgi:Predicted transcriptional regulator